MQECRNAGMQECRNAGMRNLEDFTLTLPRDVKIFCIMNLKSLGLRIAGTVFGIVAVLHFSRVVTGIQVLIGEWELPLWIN